MALSLDDAREIVKKNLPGAKIVSAIDHDNKYLFIAHRPDPLEGYFDPFFSVEKESGAFIDFSPQEYDSPLEVINKLQAAVA